MSWLEVRTMVRNAVIENEAIPSDESDQFDQIYRVSVCFLFFLLNGTFLTHITLYCYYNK